MIDIGIVKECKNPDSYGTICVKCNECGRFNVVRKCVNCGKELKGTKFEFPNFWGKVEFWDSLKECICHDCTKLFPSELITDGYSHKIISCKVADFQLRKAKDGKKKEKRT